MKLPGYYSSGEFARMAQVSIRTIRFYDKQNILKPSFVSPAGARFYTDSDFTRLQQILLYKYLGFSLDDIREMTVDDIDSGFLLNSLSLQKKLVQDRIEQMQLVEQAIESTVGELQENKAVNWSRMLELIHLTGMEKSYKTQYLDAGNISARIRLHSEYSVNPLGWFPWIFGHCAALWNASGADTASPYTVLELGCGNGALWTENLPQLPAFVQVTLSDISDGMIRDVRRTIGTEDARFAFQTFDCAEIPAEDHSYDLIIANHVLFYCTDIPKVCEEVRRVMKPGGAFLCSAYGPAHMKEITELVQEFDSRIVLSGEKLYERFGLSNGYQILEKTFRRIETRHYDDAIVLAAAEPLIAYILSCHGNQNQYLPDRYRDFRTFVEKKVKKGFRITKDAGIFLCRDPKA